MLSCWVYCSCGCVSLKEQQPAEEPAAEEGGEEVKAEETKEEEKGTTDEEIAAATKIQAGFKGSAK